MVWHYREYLREFWPDDSGYFIWDLDAANPKRLNDPDETHRLSNNTEYIHATMPEHPGILLLPATGLSVAEVDRRKSHTDHIMAEIDDIMRSLARSVAITEVAPWAVGPPVAALATAWILSWIIAGFRKR
ncbi:MAG: hypothetical protein E5X76_26455 [Mesorhizobium sp.]|uniref:hypothetical protein n=1 Tax=Mesorhizobium sp. TaxID=1871066 RepID=UPI00120AEB37|nr:hypothetical protein [Mesorhizobium sp.]TIP04081.1 MAG: hypothetical protein E5X72_13300 [Mesorhizobium sp.]TIP37676.1 MAG: hypothetical protein E5X77_34365 [Mesorhizobium sp.]TJV69077.1 MAG: hypothetical protein E5X76_26455 [Mesorhizobium sp.]